MSTQAVSELVWNFVFCGRQKRGHRTITKTRMHLLINGTVETDWRVWVLTPLHRQTEIFATGNDEGRPRWILLPNINSGERLLYSLGLHACIQHSVV